ncbi:MAG: hotdog fold thioesterase [Wenzhouxiangellaceae bacterium]|nr:hotdog fold thioesterase [Wenzhouxiangellaceae bacterium]MBS3747731.1 hotdog fold thioesterase [Wenzhouxiangellaceae bacterium]MBS3822642.1 hotdog fold thioesterase [Wenzhouxiangellaceae bacterium]
MTRHKRLEQLNRMVPGTLMETLGIRYTDSGEGFLEATMPVDSRHLQPMQILHGGATAALAESVASAASAAALHGTGRHPVGLDLGINHLRGVRGGVLTARAEAVHLGRSTHLWQIRMTDEDDRLVALGKLTLMVLEGSSGQRPETED